MMLFARRIGKGRDGARARAWRALRALALGLAMLGAFVEAAAGPAIDSIVVKFRDGIVIDQSAGLPSSQHAALAAALQVPYSHVGYKRGGTLKLQLLTPVALAQARAAVNRVRMLPQVLYAGIAPPQSAAAQSAAAQAAADAQTAPVQRMIVKFRDPGTVAAARGNVPLPAARLEWLTATAGQALAHERAMSGGAYVVRLFQRLPAGQARALAARLAADPSIEYAEPDVRMQPTLVPDDPSYAAQWHYLSPPAEMGGINLPPAWDVTTGAPGIVVAVIDTGVLPAHPDLAGRIIDGYDFITDVLTANDGDGRDADASDPGNWVTAEDTTSGNFGICLPSNSSFHGTHVAGTIAAVSNNATGVAGVNWGSRILPARVLGKCGGLTSDIADAIIWSAGGSVPGVPANPNPARVLNLSLSGGGSCLNVTQSAIDEAVAAGAVVVVSAGNAGADASLNSPASCDGVVTVAATGRAGQRADYTNYGAKVEIAAPGGSDGHPVLSTINTSPTSPDLGSYGYGYKEGTSMSAPHVAGVASLMLSVDPTLTPAQVLAKMQASARPFPTGTIRDCTTELCGAGIVDAAAAVLAVLPRPPTTTTLASSANPAAAGAVVTFTATVAGAAPTGAVSFRDAGVAIAGCAAAPLATVDNTSTASCSTSALAAGTHGITAVYGGDVGNAPSTSAVLSQAITGTVPGNALSNGVPVAGLAGGSGAELRYTMDVPAGATNLTIRIAGGSGDADLYVRFGAAPTTSSYNCRPYLSGNSETCTFATTQAGAYHVMLRGYASFSGVTLTGTYTLPAANVAPTANFTFTTSGLTANFTDASTDGDGAIASRSWTFGDGGTSTAANPSRAYASAGTYDVTLTVTDNASATASVTKSVTVTTPPPNAPPAADFTFTTTALTASFTDASTDSDGTIASRSWAFGDGGTSTAANPSRTYALPGTYSVTLSVTDNASATASVTKSVTVTAPPPPSNELANGVPVAGLAGSSGAELRYTMDVPAGATNLTIRIAGGSGDADLYVRFGAAPTTSSYNCRPYLSGNSETCTFATAQAGTYHVMLRGYASFSGVTLTGTYTPPGVNVAPTANFTFTTNALTAGFTDTSTDGDGTIVSRSWTFGDGGTSTAANPSRTYASAGTYDVTLTVTDNGGATGSLTRQVTVSSAPPPSNVLTNGVPVTGLTAGTGTELRYTMNVPAGVTNLRFAIAGGSGDADLYVRFGAAPTTSTWDCRPYRSGSNETCTFATAQAGTYHVTVRAYSSFSGVTLTGSH